VCETCGRYIKIIDLRKDPAAVPVIDDLATVPLDLWAIERGYEKIELNLAGI
jgi:FdhE protein